MNDQIEVFTRVTLAVDLLDALLKDGGGKDLIPERVNELRDIHALLATAYNNRCPVAALESMDDDASDHERRTIEWSIANSAVRLMQLKRLSAPGEILNGEKRLLQERVARLPQYAPMMLQTSLDP